MADPLRQFLALHPDDYRLAVAIVNRAEAIRAEQAKVRADYQAHQIAVAVSKLF